MAFQLCIPSGLEVEKANPLQMLNRRANFQIGDSPRLTQIRLLAFMAIGCPVHYLVKICRHNLQMLPKLIPVFAGLVLGKEI